MSDSSTEPGDDLHLRKIVEAVIRVGLVALLIAWCFNIIRPFLTPVVWGMILAVATYPAFLWLARQLGNNKLAAGFLALSGFAIVVVPTFLFAGSLIESGKQITQRENLAELRIPPPPDDVADWPLIGDSVHTLWSQASQGIEPLLVKFAPQLRDAAIWLVGASVGTGVAFAQGLLSIVIAAVMLVGASSGTHAAGMVAKRLAGTNGEAFVLMAAQTIRSVALGIVGVAIIQAGLIGAGFLAVGVPHAGIWALLCLIFGVLQLPTFLIVLPVVIYMFAHVSTPVAVAFAIWEFVASVSDTFLKPILLSRGVKVPMLVIFMGAIGGFVTSGFIGLFIGAVVLSLGFELASAWVRDASELASAPTAEAAD